MRMERRNAALETRRSAESAGSPRITTRPDPRDRKKLHRLKLKLDLRSSSIALACVVMTMTMTVGLARGQLIRPVDVYKDLIRTIHDYFNNTCIILLHSIPNSVEDQGKKRIMPLGGREGQGRGW